MVGNFDEVWKKLKECEKDYEKGIFVFKTEEKLKEYIENTFELSYHKINALNRLNLVVRNTKYKRRKGRVLGNKSKAMPDTIYQKMIEYIRKFVGKKEALAIQFEAIEGPRGEDVVELRTDDINWEENKITIYNQKRERYYDVPISNEIKDKLKEFILKHREIIEEHGHFVFYSANPVQTREHISQKYLKQVVHDALRDLGLQKVYGKSVDGRDLNLYSLHSCRGHAGTRVYKKTNGDLGAVQELLDHQPGSTSTTMLYIERDEKKLENVI